MNRRVYLICPVRLASPADTAAMAEYVARLEAEGCEVHFPPRDVDQSNDDGGVRICMEHLDAMLQCNETHVWLAEEYIPGTLDSNNPGDQTRKTMSIGSHFDLGMAYMLKAVRDILRVRASELIQKDIRVQPEMRFVIANGPLQKTEHKSFENVLLDLVQETNES